MDATEEDTIAAFAAFSGHCSRAADEHAKIVKELTALPCGSDGLRTVAVVVQLGSANTNSPLKDFNHSFALTIPLRALRLGASNDSHTLMIMLSRMFGIKQDAFYDIVVLVDAGRYNATATDTIRSHPDWLHGLEEVMHTGGKVRIVANNHAFRITIDPKYAALLTDGHSKRLFAKKTDSAAAVALP